MKFSNLVRFLFALIVVITFPLAMNQVDQLQAETADDPAPHIEHKGELKGSVLFDNAHGQTAGAADWVIDGAFSDFGEAIAEEGYDVDELRQTTPITYDDLKDYDVFVLPEANIPFKESEQDAMLEYVDGGGSIFFIADHYNADRNLNRWDAGEIFNGYRRGAYEDPTKGMEEDEANSEAMQDVTSTDWLGDNFGIRFRSNALGDITSGQTVVPADDSFGITEDVGVVEMHAGSTLAILDPDHAKGLVYLPEDPPVWGPAVDEGVYNGGGIEEGPFAAIGKYGKGKAAFLGDSSPVEDATPKYLHEETGAKKKTYDGFESEGDNAVYLIQTIEWLAEQEDYTSFEGQVPLSEKTPLKDFEEDPSLSTEPEHEPWKEPSDGYNWWDPSTFAPGSYGSEEDASNPDYDFVHQDTLPNQDEFQIRIVVNNLQSGETISNLKIGIYKEGGEQLATFKNEDGWASSPGYSDEFDVTADASGVAHKDLTLTLNPDYEGPANLRLKVDGNNAETVSVDIADVEVESLPPFETPVPERVSIADARDVSDGKMVTVEGVITTTPGIWGGDGFYLQDDTGGIYVFPSDGDFQLGQRVELSAKVTTFNGEKELEDIIQVTDKGEGDIPEAVTVETVDDSNQGQLVKLENIEVQHIGDPDSYGTFEFDAVDGDTTTRIRVDNRSGFDYDAFTEKYAEGDHLDVTGIASVFNGTFQLKPRSADDFEFVEEEKATGAQDIIASIEALADQGEFSSEPSVYHLIAHLDIVVHYENVGNIDKVIDHLEHFKALVDQYNVMGLMTDQAHNQIISESNAVIEAFEQQIATQNDGVDQAS